MGVSRSKGWTEDDINPDDPEAYQGGGIVTPELRLREEQEKLKKKRKKRIASNQEFISLMKDRGPMSTGR